MERPSIAPRSQESPQISTEAAEKLATDRELVSDFKRKKLEIESKNYWDKFYLRNKTNFFKDRHWPSEEFADLCSDIDFKSNLTLLEAGCGVGNFLFPFAEAAPSAYFYACDFSDRAVRFVQDCEKFDASRMTAFAADLTDESKESALTLNVPEESVDLCTLLFVLSAINPEKMLTVISNLHSRMRSGGSVIVRDYGIYDHAMLRFGRGHKLGPQFYVRQDGTRAFYFKTEDLSALFPTDKWEQVHCYYVSKETVNRKEGLQVGRVFVQARFRKL